MLTYIAGEFMTGGKSDATKGLKYALSFFQEILFLEIIPEEIIGDILICLNRMFITGIVIILKN